MKSFFYIVLGIFIGLFLNGKIISGCIDNHEYDYQQIENNLNTAQDSIRMFLNRNGELETRIESFSATNLKSLLSLETKDSTILKLQDKVRQLKNAKSIIVHDTKVIYKDSGSVKIDTFYDGSLAYPLIAESNDEWFYGKVELFKNRSEWNLIFDNSMTYAINKQPSGLFGFKGYKYEVVSQSENPYVKTKELRSIIYHEVPKRFGFGFNVGFGYDGGFSPYIGVGVSYNLFQW